jgi:hypothetical protein
MELVQYVNYTTGLSRGLLDCVHPTATLTRRHNPEDLDLNLHCNVNLSSYKTGYQSVVCEDISDRLQYDS